MICAGINTAVENCGFDLSVCRSVELPGALWCLGCGVLGLVNWFRALFSTSSFGSFDFFGALGGWLTTLQSAAHAQTRM